LYTIRDILTRSDDQLRSDGRINLPILTPNLFKTKPILTPYRKDSVLKILPADSSLATTFLIQKIAIDSKYHRLDTVNKKLMVKIGLLQNRTSSVYISILDLKDQIDTENKRFWRKGYYRQSTAISGAWMPMKATILRTALSKTADHELQAF
jgi:potassium efflux system protein